MKDQPTERQVRIQLKDHIDRVRKHKRDEPAAASDIFRPPGSDDEDEEVFNPLAEDNRAGGDQQESTLRRNDGTLKQPDRPAAAKAPQVCLLSAKVSLFLTKESKNLSVIFKAKVRLCTHMS